MKKTVRKMIPRMIRTRAVTGAPDRKERIPRSSDRTLIAAFDGGCISMHRPVLEINLLIESDTERFISREGMVMVNPSFPKE